MPITFNKFAECSEEIQKAVRGTDIKDVAWVALVDNLDDWCDFTPEHADQLVFNFREDVNFNYLFREGKPVIVFFATPTKATSQLFRTV